MKEEKAKDKEGEDCVTPVLRGNECLKRWYLGTKCLFYCCRGQTDLQQS